MVGRRVARGTPPQPARSATLCPRALLVALLFATCLAGAPLFVPGSASAATSPTATYVASRSGKGATCSPSDPCALREAVRRVDEGGGTVELLPGAYLLHHRLVVGSGAAVKLVGSLASSTIVSVVAGGPALRIVGGGPVTLDRISMTGALDGAVLATGESLTVEDSTFAGDGVLGVGPAGGAIDFAPVGGQGMLDVEGTTFFDDQGGAIAGAIAVTGGDAAIEGSTFVDNTATGGAGALGGAGQTSLQADILANDGTEACAPGMTVGLGVFVAGGSCDGAIRASDSQLFSHATPVLASNGGPVKTVELAQGRGDPALSAIAVAQPALAEPNTTFCSLRDARGVARLRPSASTCAAGALQPDPPVITSVSPDQGHQSSLITATGTGLSLVTSLTLETVAVTFSYRDHTLRFSVPPGLFNANAPLTFVSPDGTRTTRFILSGPFTIATTSLPTTEVGAPYSTVLVASGGAGGNRWAAAGLPPGLTLAGDGLLFGRAASLASATVLVSVTDREGQVASARLSLIVGPGPTITTSQLPIGQVAAAYSVALAASGGTAPYQWSVAGTSSLPPGLLLSSSGLLSGQPGAIGTTTIDLQVSDANGGSATATLTLTIAAPPPPPERFGILTAGGRFTSYGASAFSLVRHPPAGHFIAEVANPAGNGYWLLTSTGRVVGVGGAHSLGSVGPVAHAGRLVGIASDSAGTGYWVADATGKVFGFGSAHAIAPSRTNAVHNPVVAIVADPTGTGYWLLESSGRVDAYGDATSYGFIGKRLRVHAVAMAAAASGDGYFILTSAGRVYSFGAGHALGKLRKNRPALYVGIAAAPYGLGYWVVTSHGMVLSLGSARRLEEPIPPPEGGVIAIAAGS